MEFQTPEPSPQAASIPATSLMEIDTRKATQGRGALYYRWALTKTLMTTSSELDYTCRSQKSSPGHQARLQKDAGALKGTMLCHKEAIPLHSGGLRGGASS